MAAKKRTAKKNTAKKTVAKKNVAKKSVTKKRSSKPAKKSAANSARPARRGPRSAAQRVSGLLVMLPWIMQRQRVKISTMARQFNLSEAELVEDLQMAAVCGVPPYTPDALIDVYMDDGMVIAEVPLVFSRPLKLSTAELFAVSVMAQTAMQLPGANKKGPLASALAKLSPLMPAGAETIKVQLPKTRFVKELLAAVETGERQEIASKNSQVCRFLINCVKFATMNFRGSQRACNKSPCACKSRPDGLSSRIHMCRELTTKMAAST